MFSDLDITKFAQCQSNGAFSFRTTHNANLRNMHGIFQNGTQHVRGGGIWRAGAYFDIVHGRNTEHHFYAANPLWWKGICYDLPSQDQNTPFPSSHK